MKRATLAVIIDGNNVLLGEKKKGEIGTGTLNGPGGKIEEGETSVDCVIRETREEVGIEIDPADLQHIATITFFADTHPDFVVDVYRTDRFSGSPMETSDMIPNWYPIDQIPFARMLESDREWFGKAARGEMFCANVYYKERARGLERVEFFPYSAA